MTFKNAARTFFATPELLCTLFSVMAQHDLTRCIRVCKEWQQVAEPILWKCFCPDLPFGHRLRGETMTGLIRNQPHIQEIELSTSSCNFLWAFVPSLCENPQPDDSAVAPSSFYTNLRILTLCESSYRIIPQLALDTLLHYNHRLTHLTLPHVGFDFDESLLAAISKLRCLQLLHIESYGSIDDPIGSRTVSLLLQACLSLPKLTKLLLDFHMVWEGEGKDTRIPDLETIIKDASRTRFSQHSDAKQIKSLYLPTCDEGGRKNPLPFLLLKSDLLDLNCFMIPTFTQDSRPEDVEQAIREYCPGLRHVECPHFCDDGQDGRFVRAFIRGCTRLQSFTSEYFSDRVYGGMLADEEPPGDPRFIIQELTTHHWETLQEFELTYCEQVFSCDQQAILSQCKQLKQFTVWASSVNGSAGIKFTDVARGNWICKDLRELGLTLNRRSQEDEDLGLEGIALAAKHTYAQIGRLEQLDWLAFNIDKSTGTVAKESDYAWDLTLSRGWLGEMAGLKNLETLILYADFLSKMGQAEVEFIHEHWPLLTSISLKYGASQLAKEPHWQWLFNKRPNFRLESI